MKLQLLSIALVLSTTAPSHAAKPRDIVVGEKTLVQRAVIPGASSRAIAVGQPGGFNYAFDAVNASPLFSWQGDFLDFRGEADGRGGQGVKTLGSRQTFGTAKNPLRIGAADAEPRTLRFHGYRRDDQSGEPTFLFEVDGQEIEQTFTSSAEGIIETTLYFKGKNGKDRFYLLDAGRHEKVSLGNALEWQSQGIIRIPADAARAEITITPKAPEKPYKREVVKQTGAELFQTYCIACHSTDGSKLIGPTFKGLWTTEKMITRNGKAETIVADEAYVRESILKPQAAIVKGYEAVPMADLSGILSTKQVDLLIDFLKSQE
ncbi:c-type cytochrome [Luteolibacter algae]|uniref:C-type cytochrome n=1 Tax=Luteolibacter algae TaxID=454151 RepID=A0ABW5D5W8_9BACT